MHRIEIEIDEASGSPCVIVPEEFVWSLVEYLAFQRLYAEYSFTGDDFLALLPHLTREGAQQVLDDWAAYDPALSPSEEIAELQESGRR